MHSRIETLAQQVEKWISSTCFEGMPEDKMTYDEIFHKKFSELIIEQCIGLVENEASQYAEPVWAVELIDDIKEHFGVEDE